MADKTGLGVAEIVGNLRDPILRLAAQHGAMNVRVFGSVARGEAMPDSDLDLLVRWDYGRMSAWGGAELDAELEALLGRRIDVVSENGLHPALRETILREAVPL